MYVREWLRKWFLLTVTIMVIIMGCGAGLLWSNFQSDKDTDSHYVINQVRLQVNDIMLYLAKHNQTIPQDAQQKDTLMALSREYQVDYIYVQLDGQVQFNTSTTNTIDKIDLKTALHYDLYHARIEPESYNIAFPVIDEQSQTQVGNVIFTMPAASVLIDKSYASSWALLIGMIILGAILLLLLILIRRKMKRDILNSIHQLKQYSEAILKGNYEQQVSYQSMDEIGELYAMFDQMRMEIMDYSIRRDKQEQSQKELISNISHEIKTPLTTLKAYIEAIREGVCSDMPTVMEYVEVMYNNTEKMKRLTDDLLVHALKELGQISVTLTEQYSKDVLLTIIQPIGHYVRTTGVTFIEPKFIPNVLIHVDAHRLEQVISNLITNALKHTSPGDTIRLDTEVEQGMLKLTISDTGEGMLPQDMPFVFDRYFKGKMKSNPKNEGTGLGLSICKHIIEAHNGSISFKSVRGQGTVFYCLIPL